MKMVTEAQVGTASCRCNGWSSLRIGIALGALLAGLTLWSVPAQGYEGINSFEMTPTETQAGGHPDVQISTSWNNRTTLNGNFGEPPSNPCACDDPRIVFDHFPTGFIGNPHAVPTCELAEFSFGRCPAATQVGISEPLGNGFGVPVWVPLYNLTPHPDEASLTGFWIPLAGAPFFISLSGRTESDYGLDAESSPIYHVLAFPGTAVTLWGVPAEPEHDWQRFIPPLKGLATCFGEEACPEVTGIAANIPPVPYLEAPTECGVPLTSSEDIEYYTHTVWHAEDPWPETTGCEQLTFNPSLTAQPTTTQADAASGVDIDLKVPQEQSPTTPSPSEIRSLTTTLPEGFSINPNAADGKVSCSDSDTAIGTRHAATCPEFSKVGTLALDSSALPVPIPGAIYLGEPKPGDRYRLILAADGFGTHFKLAGSVHPNAQTGQLVVSFKELPQSPLTEFNMHFFGSERGLLATPTQCGSYPVNSEFVPWDGALPPQHSLSYFEIKSGPGGPKVPCPSGARPFSPQVKAGTANPSAGIHTPFTLEVVRADGDQNLRTVNVKTPPGFVATLAGIPYCPDSGLATLANPSYSGLAEIAAPACPAASLIGTAVTGTGAGTHPLYSTGKVYLAGPYKGAPLSLEVVVPAVSGPYDLGNVVVRSALFVDPATAQVSTVSDPITEILDGIPLRIRSIRIELDRPNFTLNPTNCDPFLIEAAIGGNEGAVASLTSHFQAADCAELPFAPKLGLKLSGSTKRNGNPALRAVLTAKPGEANIAQTIVAMPPNELLDNAHIKNPCTRAQFAKENCPPGSVLGSAMAETPLLEKPLEGPVYLMSGFGHRLPDIVADLHGQVDIQLDGRIDTVKGGLRASFETVPDVPVSQFVLNMQGGAKGLLANEEDLCRTKNNKASVTMMGQNNAVVNTKARLQTACGSKARHKRDRRLYRERTVR